MATRPDDPHNLLLPWEIARRRSSMSSRRGSLVSSVSLFDFSLFPPRSETSDNADPDPFAPLSIAEGLPLAKHLENHSANDNSFSFHHLLHDGSESTAPSLSASSFSSLGSSSIDAASYSHLPSPQTSRKVTATLPPVSPQAVTSKPKVSPVSPSSPAAATAAAKPTLPTTGLFVNDDDDDQQRFKPFHEEKWSTRYTELIAFHKEHGHAAVPHTYPKNPQLARWVKRQRRQYKLREAGRPSTMTAERLELLNSIGFIWDSHDVNWKEKLNALEIYRKEFGNCNVPSNYKDKKVSYNPNQSIERFNRLNTHLFSSLTKLATWVKCQRRQYKLYWDGKPSAMTTERIGELEKVGFEWEIRAAAPRNNIGQEDYKLLYKTISEM